MSGLNRMETIYASCRESAAKIAKIGMGFGDRVLALCINHSWHFFCICCLTVIESMYTKFL